MNDEASRRAFLAIAGTGALFAACRRRERVSPDPVGADTLPSADASGEPGQADAGTESDEKETTATEDLMREHGVIRRVLVVYREAALRLRSKVTSVPADALQKAAKLMSDFGEAYHERQLEEAHVFPAVTRTGGAAASEVGTLLLQHERGREITAFVLAVTKRGIGAVTAEPLARSLEAFARMYEEHAAREDTIVFPAWKDALSVKQLDEMGDLFEEIERKTFGADGFDDAVEQIAAIERAIGLDPAALIAPRPPAF